MADDTPKAEAALAATPAPPPMPVAIFKKRGGKGKAMRKQAAASPPLASKDSDDSDFSSSEDEAGHRIKRRKLKSGTITTSSSSSKAQSGAGKNDSESISGAPTYSADRSAALNIRDWGKQEAVKGSDWFDSPDGQMPSSRELLGSTRSAPSGGGGGEGTYRGLKNQTSYVQRNPDAPNRKVGPIKAPTNIRTITITDMAADVCKDYKQTGFCGFGDNCKFLHAREDYQAGWQLDKEWENVTRGSKQLAGTVVASADRKRKAQEGEAEDGGDEDQGEMLDNIPFVCLICKEDYKSPVVTRCGHYFCESCALKRYRKDPGCAVCGAGTGGVFNAAKRLKGMLEKKREREKRQKEEARERGEEVSDDDDDDDDDEGE
ncbi:autophagy-like protein 3 [Cladorrhinum samala]|uniref:Pre-mRNA-splicing factor CWC24 n=1 Tax=Cladorrhinum samala TaxID=585594 RepID=A0AAV9HCX4_9PEZI|nr:autophagy-like protein 3 [Cladorrhinum samala]